MMAPCKEDELFFSCGKEISALADIRIQPLCQVVYQRPCRNKIQRPIDFRLGGTGIFVGLILTDGSREQLRGLEEFCRYQEALQHRYLFPCRLYDKDPKLSIHSAVSDTTICAIFYCLDYHGGNRPPGIHVRIPGGFLDTLFIHRVHVSDDF